MHPLAHMVRQPAQGQHVRRTIERQGIAIIQTFIGHHFFVDLVEPRIFPKKAVPRPLDGKLYFRHIPYDIATQRWVPYPSARISGRRVGLLTSLLSLLLTWLLPLLF